MIETNIHPADELSAVREEIQILQKRADELRDWLLDNPENRIGTTYMAVIKAQKRESLDRKALTEAYGEKAIEPFVKTTGYNIVNLVETPRESKSKG